MVVLEPSSDALVLNQRAASPARVLLSPSGIASAGLTGRSHCRHIHPTLIPAACPLPTTSPRIPINCSGGDFTSLTNQGAYSANGVARYDGVALSALTSSATLGANGVNGPVTSVAGVGSVLYVAGAFTLIKTGTSSGTTARFIASYNTATGTWSALSGLGLNGVVKGLSAYGGSLLVAGAFNATGSGTFTGSMAVYTGSAWANITSSSVTDSSTGVNGTVNIVVGVSTQGGASTTYVAGGPFTRASGGTAVKSIAQYDTGSSTGAGWARVLGSPYVGVGSSNPVYALANLDATSVVVGYGGMTLADGTSAKYVAIWNSSSSTWSTLPCSPSNGVNSAVYAIAVNGTRVFLGGAFTALGNSVAMKYVTMYDTSTSTFTALGAGTGGTVNALALLNNKLYVGGSFTTIDGTATSCNRVAAWDIDAQVWSILDKDGTSNGVSGVVKAFAVSGSTLWIGGTFR